MFLTEWPVKSMWMSLHNFHTRHVQKLPQPASSSRVVTGIVFDLYNTNQGTEL